MKALVIFAILPKCSGSGTGSSKQNPRQYGPYSREPADNPVQPEGDQVPAPAQLSRPPPKGCLVCSFAQKHPEKQVPVFHRHFSSLRLRELTGAEYQTSPAQYLCPTCKSLHNPHPGNRIKIVLSSSTLHEYIPPNGAHQQYAGDKIHMDYITIPGANIETIMNALRLDYV